MSFLDNITVLILTYNEEDNIGRTLAALTRFLRIVVLDSASNDSTVVIAAAAANVRVVTRIFDTHATQWNFGLTQCGIDTDWVLALDADYVLSESLVNELSDLSPGKDTTGYRLKFQYCIEGHRLSATLYPPVVALYRRELAHYIQTGHTQRLKLNGFIEELGNYAYHDDRKPFSRWLSSQKNYAELEADYLMTAPQSSLRRTDRLRLMAWPAPFLVFLYTAVFKRCLLNGWPGWLYVLQRTLAETVLAIEIVGRRLRKATRETN